MLKTYRKIISFVMVIALLIMTIPVAMASESPNPIPSEEGIITAEELGLEGFSFPDTPEGFAEANRVINQKLIENGYNTVDSVQSNGNGITPYGSWTDNVGTA